MKTLPTCPNCKAPIGNLPTELTYRLDNMTVDLRIPINIHVKGCAFCGYRGLDMEIAEAIHNLVEDFHEKYTDLVVSLLDDDED